MNAKPIHVTTAEFESLVLESPEPVVVDFWAPWCGPCRAIGPVLDELAEQYAGKVTVAKVNVDEEPALANTFGVRGIPTLFTVENGKPTGQIVGYSGRGPLEDLFEKLGNHEKPSEEVAQA
jgi:thioredoxin 1